MTPISARRGAAHLAALGAALFAAGACCVHAAAPTPQEAALNGVWKIAQPLGNALKDAKGKTPPLNAAGKKIYNERRALLAKGDAAYDLANARCKPMGFPRVLWDGGPFDIQLQTDKVVFFGYTFNRNHRNLPWGPGLPTLQIPRYYGTSAARWAGDTLVVESGMFVEATLLDASGLPHSEELTLIERYTPMEQGRKLQVRLTVTDPIYYSKPWEVVVRFDRVANGRIAEDVCQERSAFYKPLLGLQ